MLSTDAILNRRTNGTVTAVVTVVALLCGAGYALGMWFLGRRWAHQARSKAFTLSKWPRRLVPAFHVCLTLTSLLETALDGWLLGQYHYTGRYATVGSRDGVRASLIAAVWTLVCSIAFTAMFLHPSLWRHPIASSGAQAIWILLTWCIWVAATATMTRALPLLSTKTRCAGAEYCGQLRTVFGLSLAEVLLLTLGMFGMARSFWKTYYSPRY
ncbi:uncharacterized protein PHACADRAFT_207449 [Phanerochaete carnosa HHB-10118-sp]|uniref:MARVEL domain-containing protein n=1 Tax=Phanerochaete carnosa (strain HHB-10118-sp) TaxID=650164 RepID=K5W424_PHACS|nr:uncharacterized protein PHACADRAFT_207449 [Phanerochaete carnosa HHB-10118-sp]EKM58648.1 hypothetical protein PHACADRAFT_207449 [Phanerochaete carnosa HHB-10118-sp]